MHGGVDRLEITRTHMPLQDANVRRVQSVQRVTLRKILTQPGVGGFCFAQHRGIGIEEYVDGNERFLLAWHCFLALLYI